LRALLLTELRGPDALALTEVADPVPGDDQVLVEVHAAGIGFADLLIISGGYQMHTEPPFVPGGEFAGRVAAAPAGSELRPGDRVVGPAAAGSLAELAVSPADLTFPIPDDLGFAAAAGLIGNHLTAHLALVDRAALAPGETVLVHGAGGGVGVASIQVALAAGAGQVIAIASTEAKRELALREGAAVALDPSEDWPARVRELTGGGADVVVDPVSGDAFDQSLRCTAPRGRILVIGFAGGRIAELKTNRVLLRSQSIVGVSFSGLLASDRSFPGRGHADLMKWWRQGLIRPVPGPSHPLAEGGLAFEELSARQTVGKTVIRVADED
jgi:NADPH2:quinone reductase